MSDKNKFFGWLTGEKKEKGPGGEEQSLQEQLDAANGRIKEFEEIEGQAKERFEELEGKVKAAEEKVAGAEKDRDEKVKAAEKDRDEKVKAAETDRDAKVKAAGEAQAKAEKELAELKGEMPKKISEGVREQMAALGVSEDKLPGKVDPEKKETEGLKGKARVAAAINAQLAARN